MTPKLSQLTFDAIIIGARCAGAATGMLMARKGARVLIVDRELNMHDALSTHALMRPAVTLLDHWGLLDQIVKAGTPAIRHSQFCYLSERMELPVKASGRAEGLYAPRRWLLDRILRDAAVAAGAELRTGTSLVALVKDDTGRVIGADLRHPDGGLCRVYADIVVGADGRQSLVSQQAGAATIAASNDCTANVYTYVDGVPNEGYRWYYGDGIAAGLIPTTDGMHCLFASTTHEAFKGHFKADAFAGALKILAKWEPELAQTLAVRGSAEKMRRFTGAPGHIKECVGPGWALVGDAGYFKDPATAHGITDAFLDAHRLARAWTCGAKDMLAYQIARDEFAHSMFQVTQRIASMNWDFDTLKTLHQQLNACMKDEHRALDAPEPSTALAA